MKSRDDFHTSFKDAVDADLKQTGYDHSNTTWHSIRMFAMEMASRYARGANDDLPTRYQYELDLHELWYWVVQSAKYVSADHPAQNRLACQVLHTSEMGLLRKFGPKNAEEGTRGAKVATTSNGNIWSDLPFLVEEVQAAWSMSGNFPSVERNNLSTFIARLASVGVRDP